ncbi:hypothetical protein FRB95_011937 [Tulasnella sp. JGI-2019a]|nr:hypothetical protein FRB95_011937 [Tulasnella sp. JGI-2019a]
MLAISLLLYASIAAAASPSYSPAALAASFNLSKTLIPTFPSSPVDSSTASTYISSSNWLVSGSVDNPQNLQFVADPYPNSSPNQQNPSATSSDASPTVLQITYPSGSFSHSTGGTQFSNFFNSTASSGSPYQSMILSYEVAFPQGFQFVKGGKLPGLRGGPLTSGCGSGGNQPDGEDCFSMRLMWRALGTGEAYAYIPEANNLCSESNIICNDDGFGVSISRAVFSFTPTEWTRITMLVQLNDPGYANGRMWLYYNDLQAIRQDDLYYRSSDAINSIQGLFFSTFFGGNDASWATPVTQNTYFRNIQLYAGTSPSNVTGAQPVKSFNAAPALKFNLGFSSVVVGILVTLGLSCL